METQNKWGFNMIRVTIENQQFKIAITYDPDALKKLYKLSKDIGISFLKVKNVTNVRGYLYDPPHAAMFIAFVADKTFQIENRNGLIVQAHALLVARLGAVEKHAFLTEVWASLDFVQQAELPFLSPHYVKPEASVTLSN